jgi:Zn finger protein HypA/HybF involved in hydrogenase expression
VNDHSKWIEAATALITNPYSQVLCPNCGLAYLTIEDEEVDAEHIDRHLKCPHCNAHETVLKRVDKRKSSAASEEAP